MFEFHGGAQLSIWFRPHAETTLNAAEANVRDACKAQFRARLAHLADSGTLRSPDHIHHEGSGIYAVKATCGLRAYGWFDHVNGRKAFIVSHVILKKWQKLDPADRDRAEREREVFRAHQRDRKS